MRIIQKQLTITINTAMNRHQRATPKQKARETWEVMMTTAEVLPGTTRDPGASPYRAGELYDVMSPNYSCNSHNNACG